MKRRSYDLVWGLALDVYGSDNATLVAYRQPAKAGDIGIPGHVVDCSQRVIDGRTRVHVLR